MVAPGPGTAGTPLSGASAGTAPIAVPAGNVGDIVLIDLYLEADRTVTPHTGFASVGSRQATSRQWHYKYWWRADSTSAFTATFSFTSIYRRGFAVRYPDCIATGTPYEGAVGGTNGGTSSTDTPSLSLTTTGPDRRIVHSYTGFNTGTWTPETGYTERVDSNEVGGSEIAQASAGSTGAVVATKSSDTLTAWLLALLPVDDEPEPQEGSSPILLGASGELAVPPYFLAVDGASPLSLAGAGSLTGARSVTGSAPFTAVGVGTLARAMAVSGSSAIRLAGIGAVERFKRTIRFLISAVNYDAVNTYVEFVSGKAIMTVEDIGRAPTSAAATDRRGEVVIGEAPPPPPPAKVRYDFDIQPYSSRGYEGDGSLLAAAQGDTYMHQGDIGTDGNRRSWMWFDPNTAGLGSNGSLNGMFGVPYADVELCELYLYYDHWYFSGGGTSWVGWHTGNSPGANVEPAGGFPSRIRTDWPGRDVGMWINLKQNTEIMDAIRNGQLKGFMLGNTGDPTRVHYGYAIGANGILSRKPGFRAVYYK